MKILHIISGLGDGGAESNLYKVCKYDKSNEHIVISLLGAGKYGLLLEKINLRVFYLNISLKNFLFSIYKLIKIIYQNKPDLVQTWMYHADLLGGIISKILGIKKIIWNIRNSNLKLNKSKFTTILIVKLLALLSNYIPTRIISCSKKAKIIHVNIGYKKKKIVQIPNGYDLTKYRLLKNKSIDLRKKLNLKKKVALLAMVARYDLQKDHINLLSALKIINEKNLNFFVILVGHSIKNNKDLLQNIKRLKLTNKIKLFDSKNNIPQLMTEIDIHILSSSYGEGFPNVVAEAMAGKTPCIVTDVGDAADIVKDTGWVVPPKNPKLLSKAIQLALNEFKYKVKWTSRKNKCKNLIKNKYDISKIVSEYNKIWQEAYI